MKTKLSPTQEAVLAKFADGKPRCAYDVQESLATLRALVRKGKLKDVTPRGALGSMFSPRTTYEFKLV